MEIPDNFLNSFKNPRDAFVMFYILCKADKGVLETTVKEISDGTGFTVRTVRLSLSRLEDGKQIVKQTSNKNTVITVCKSSCCEVAKKPNNKQTANKKANNIDERKKKFYTSLIPFVDKYGKEIVRAFYNYWSEYNKSKTQMRFEREVTWQLSSRFVTWNTNEKKYNKKCNASTTREDRENEAANLISRLAAENK